MSRKDLRRSLRLTPDAEVWAALSERRQPGRSLSDVARRALENVDWEQVSARPEGQGHPLLLQLPKDVLRKVGSRPNAAAYVHSALAKALLDQEG